ncbi:protein kinase PKP1 [Lachancea thermotolerans CBS 6340]|uniref:Protein-serine/threonine kinase n=1 Tax=Lachancea thermotolerans (strain ATCC 56472 / CBS 6340 / NRRL Y-8284) TaxID=559295 RepID=C5DBM7_LACTC|nr:KLTH0A03916p [Lachancea thermotolerans CBS 6340]CAR21184.1 KLTH0A03916p [Lachancea thermotolerans CBS 6340]
MFARHSQLAGRGLKQLAITVKLPRLIFHSCATRQSYSTKTSMREKLKEVGFEELYRIRSNTQLLIQDFAKKPIPPLSYEFLTQYKVPLTENQKYTLTIQTVNLLLMYTCRRLVAIQRLPYIAVLNPNIEQTNRLYLRTLESLLSLNYPYGLHDQGVMTKKLTEFLDDHQDTLVTLSRGFQEIMDFFPKEAVFDFLNLHLRDRIAMKLLATHYLALVSQKSNEEPVIGVLHKNLKISELVRRVEEFVGDLCFVKYDHQLPIEILEGEDVTFPCIPTDLEYVLTEILKNSSRAHIENSVPENNTAEKPIEVTIVRNDNDLKIRIRDFGGGIPPDVEDRMFDYSYSTVNSDAKDSGMSAYVIPGEDVCNVSGMGFGLPMCKAYMEMFGGSVDIQSLWGWGTDAYICLKGPSPNLLK